MYGPGLTNTVPPLGSLVLFADDLLLHKVIHTTYDFQALQEDVNSLTKWIGDHNLSLNVRKCKSLHVCVKKAYTFLSGQSVLIREGSVIQILRSGN